MNTKVKYLIFGILAMLIVGMACASEPHSRPVTEFEECRATGTTYVDDSTGTECMLYYILLELREIREELEQRP